MPFYAQDIRAAQLHLRKTDPVMSKIIKQVGPFTLKAQRDRYQMLVRSIVSQQISVAAARSIMGRLIDDLKPGNISPESLIKYSQDELRPLGLSPQKSRYIVDLTQKIQNGDLELGKLGRLNDNQVIEKLTQVTGIGVWTAQMFLIFALARNDIFPGDDLGIQSAIKGAYGLRKMPDKKKLDRVSKPWAPYRSIASWYLWRSLEKD